MGAAVLGGQLLLATVSFHEKFHKLYIFRDVIFIDAAVLCLYNLLAKIAPHANKLLQ